MRPIQIVTMLAGIASASIFAACDAKTVAAPPVVQPLSPPARDYWPTTDWRTAAPETRGLDAAALKKAEDFAFARTGDEQNRSGVRTDALLVIRNGYIVLERYARNFTAEMPHNGWSMGKSFANAITGVAALEGRIDIDQPAFKYYPGLGEPEKRTILVRHLLNMSSGLYWQEEYEFAPLKSTVVAMLYTRGRKDMAAFTASQSMRAQPGAFVYYSSGDSNLLMGVVRAAIPAEEYAEYPWKKLFEPIGMRATFERDASGTFVGSSYIYATARDYAKFGYLYLNDGVWDGARILPEGWVNFSRTPAPAHATTEAYDELENDVYGAQFRLNTGYAPTGLPPEWPDAPADTFAARGHWGQGVYIIPSLDMIVVRLGDDRDTRLDINELMKLIQAAIRD